MGVASLDAGCGWSAGWALAQVFSMTSGTSSGVGSCFPTAAGDRDENAWRRKCTVIPRIGPYLRGCDQVVEMGCR